MKRFIRLEDNEDGTTTFTTNIIEGEERTFVIPFALNNFQALFPMLDPIEVGETMISSMIPIPNKIEE